MNGVLSCIFGFYGKLALILNIPIGSIQSEAELLNDLGAGVCIDILAPWKNKNFLP